MQEEREWLMREGPRPYRIMARSYQAARCKAGIRFKKEIDGPYTAAFYATLFIPEPAVPKKSGPKPSVVVPTLEEVEENVS